MWFINIFVSILLLSFVISVQPCFRRETEEGIVCVCNATDCDEVPVLSVPDRRTISVYYTGRDIPGFNVRTASFTLVKNNTAKQIKLTKQTMQTIHGFGGTFTDSTGINIRKLPGTAQAFLLESYFGNTGIGYSLCKVPVGGTDFSTRPYSYDDVDGDKELKHFKLQLEDYLFKVS